MTASVNPEVETHLSSGACLEIGRVGFPPDYIRKLHIPNATSGDQRVPSLWGFQESVLSRFSNTAPRDTSRKVLRPAEARATDV